HGILETIGSSVAGCSFHTSADMQKCGESPRSLAHLQGRETPRWNRWRPRNFTGSRSSRQAFARA
ncbi:hypothetical protein AVEN_122617-1, partial [Araneus ventricosus]